jgi:hypothetical protein
LSNEHPTLSLCAADMCDDKRALQSWRSSPVRPPLARNRSAARVWGAWISLPKSCARLNAARSSPGRAIADHLVPAFDRTRPSGSPRPLSLLRRFRTFRPHSGTASFGPLLAIRSAHGSRILQRPPFQPYTTLIPARGIATGAPWHLHREHFAAASLIVRSSNHTFYDDMSQRVMEVLSRFTPIFETYSIAETFRGLDGFGVHLESHTRALRAAVLQWTGVPVRRHRARENARQGWRAVQSDRGSTL